MGYCRKMEEHHSSTHEGGPMPCQWLHKYLAYINIFLCVLHSLSQRRPLKSEWNKAGDVSVFYQMQREVTAGHLWVSQSKGEDLCNVQTCQRKIRKSLQMLQVFDGLFSFHLSGLCCSSCFCSNQYIVVSCQFKHFRSRPAKVMAPSGAPDGGDWQHAMVLSAVCPSVPASFTFPFSLWGWRKGECQPGKITI